jgi:DNA-binding CsgD family transcriptional regulator
LLRQGNCGRDLTVRERQIAEAVSRGLSNKQIAAELWIAEGTVKYHLSNIYTKLGLTNRTQLVALALSYEPAETTRAG